MSFLRRNASFVLALVLILGFGSLFSFNNPLRAVATNTTRGMTAAVWEAAQGARESFDSYGGISARATLAEENKSLREEIARLQSLSLHNDVLKTENATLRDMFGLREAYPEGVSAPVLSNPSVSPYGTFVIGSGSADGVAVGSFVLSAPRVAIGQVREVGEHTALVGLFSAHGQKSEVMINAVRATYEGRGDGNGLVVVPRGITVNVGDASVLPGLPFAIGFVGYIKSNPQDAETLVLVRVPTNLPGLSFVRIVPAPN